MAWAAALLAAGVALAATRGRPTLLPLQTFAFERGEFERAALTVTTGAADLQLRSMPEASQLATGQYGGPAAPRLDVRDGQAALRLDVRRTWLLQAGAVWPVALAADIPWQLDFQSGLGDFDLDLGNLEIASLRVRTPFGRVNVSLPAAGSASLDLDMAFGDLTVRVPDGMALRLKLAAGPL